MKRLLRLLQDKNVRPVPPVGDRGFGSRVRGIVSIAIGLIGCIAIASIARGADTGLDGNSVYSFLKSNGYVTEPASAEAIAHRKQALQPRGPSGPTTKPVSDQAVAAAVEQTRRTFPQFDHYPAYVQDSLIDAVVHGDFSATGVEPAAQAINANDWSQAAKDYGDQPGHSPAAADSFTRYAKDREIEQTWARASAVGAESFGLAQVADNSPAKVNQNLKSIMPVDPDSLQRRAGAVTAAPFQFSVGSSTNGFTDISVPTNQRFRFTVLDRHIVDGDIETIRFVNGSGTQINQTITLTSSGNNFSVKVNRGANELRIFAQNQGTLGVNSGGVRMTSTVLTGANDQDVSLNTGQTAVLRITGR